MEIMYDQVLEFIVRDFIESLIEREFGITAKSITWVNPTYNVILKQIHQVRANLVRTLILRKPMLRKMTHGRTFWL